MRKFIGVLLSLALSILPVAGQQVTPSKVPSNPVVPGSAGMVLPKGTTSDRGTAIPGKIRYNTTTGLLEYYGTSWTSVAGSFSTGDLLGTANQITVGTGTGRLVGGNATVSLAAPLSALATLGAANTIAGVNTGGTGLEYKSVASNNGTVTVTPSAGSINLAALSAATTYTDTGTTTLTASSTTHHIVTSGSGNKPFVLPVANTCAGKMLIFTKTNTAGSLQISRQGSDTLHGTQTTIFVDYEMPFILVSDGVSKWLPVLRVSGYNVNVPADTVSGYYETLPHQVHTGTSITLAGSGSGNYKTFNYFTSGSATAVTLPAANTISPGSKLIFLKRSGAGLVTVSRASTNTIRYKSSDSATSFTLPSDGSWALLQLDAANGIWYVHGASTDVLSQFGSESQITSAATTVTLTTASPRLQVMSASSGNVTYNLPLSSAAPGKEFVFLRAGAGNAIINRAGSDTIGAGSNIQLLPTQQGDSIGLVADGTTRWSYSKISNDPNAGNISGVGELNPFRQQTITSNNALGLYSNKILAIDATAGNIVVTLEDIVAGAWSNQVHWLYRSDSSANTVTVTRSGAGLIGDGAATSFTLPSRGSYCLLSGWGVTNRWRVLGSSPDVAAQIGSSLRLTGTTSAMTGGTVTVNDARVRTGDIIQATRVSGASTSSGIHDYTIIDATSFTLNANDVGDNGVWAYEIIRP